MNNLKEKNAKDYTLDEQIGFGSPGFGVTSGNSHRP
jgi:hypothetical protein